MLIPLNDVALLIVEPAVKYDLESSPLILAKLPTHPLNENSKNLTAAGWGLVDVQGPLADMLQEAQLNVWSNAECRNAFLSIDSQDASIDPAKVMGEENFDKMVCAMGDPGSAAEMPLDPPVTSACLGDSGGPLFELVDGDDSVVVHGVASKPWVPWCGVSPTMFSRVHSFLPWIDNVLSKEF